MVNSCGWRPHLDLVVAALFDRDDGNAAGPSKPVTRFPWREERSSTDPARATSGSWPSRVWRTAERLKHVKHRLTTAVLLVTALVLSTFAILSGSKPAAAANNPPGTHWPIDGLGPRSTDNAILKWDEELLETIRTYPAQTGPTVTSRAIGILHTATYDAWAAYDATAVPTMANGNDRQPVAERTLPNKTTAISWAAYQVLRKLFPTTQFLELDSKVNYDGRMVEVLGATWATDYSPARTVGENAAAAVMAYREHDGATQLGDEPGTNPPGKPYADYTGYTPTTTWGQTPQPGRWQPLCVPLPAPGQACTGTVQKALTPHWKNVTSFGLNAPNQFVPPGPPKLADGSPDPKDIDTALADTSNLTDTKKVTAEYWADGPKSEFPPGHWAVIAQALSRKRGQSLDTDAKMFFVLGNAVLDAGISAWSAKFKIDPTNPDNTWDCWRPLTAIRERYKGKMINSWLGPYQGYGTVPGEQWRPYQAPNVVTPGFPEYTSGHSTFSGAARVAIIAFTGTDSFSAKVTIRAGSSLFEPKDDNHPVGTPAKDVVLSWKNLLDASNQAGMSRRYGGIHFQSGDMDGRANGASVGYWDYDKATRYFSGNEPPLQPPAPTP